MATANKKYFIHIKEPISPVDGFEFVSLNNIETLKTGSLEHVYVHDLLDYLEESTCEKAIKLIKSRLKKNGILIIQGTDIKSLSASLLYGQIELSTFRSMVYGAGKKTSYTISNMKAIINNIEGLKIVKVQFINGSQYYIECLKYE